MLDQDFYLGDCLRLLVSVHQANVTFGQSGLAGGSDQLVVAGQLDGSDHQLQAGQLDGSDQLHAGQSSCNLPVQFDIHTSQFCHILHQVILDMDLKIIIIVQI